MFATVPELPRLCAQEPLRLETRDSIINVKKMKNETHLLQNLCETPCCLHVKTPATLIVRTKPVAPVVYYYRGP